MGVSHILAYCWCCIFLNTTKVRDKADQRGVYDCPGGCWGSLGGNAARVKRVGGLMCHGGEEKMMLRMKTCTNSDIKLHRAGLEKTHLRISRWIPHLDYVYISSNVCHHLSHSKSLHTNSPTCMWGIGTFHSFYDNFCYASAQCERRERERERVCVRIWTKESALVITHPICA